MTKAVTKKEMTKAVTKKEITGKERARGLMAKVKGLNENEVKFLQDYIGTNVVSLGTDEAFALRDNEGEIKAYRQRVQLSVADGTLLELPGPKIGGKWTKIYPISAQGYEVLSEATGTCCIFPGKVLVDGHAKENPFVVRDPANNRIMAVYARAIAFRFSSKGIPQVADWSTIFDTRAYRMIDLLSKAKSTPQAFRLLPRDIQPEIDDNNPNATWTPYDFDESAILWVNTSHDEALTWYSQIIHREKKSMDFAQTFARRNAVKHLLGLQKAPGPVWNVTVLCWRPVSGNIVKWDATHYEHLQNRVEDIVHGSTKFQIDHKPKISKGTERVEDQESFDTIMDQEEPEQTETITPQEGDIEIDSDLAEKPELSPEEEKILKQETYIKKDFTEEYVQACRNKKVDPDMLHNPETATILVKEVNAILDAMLDR
jgi:hypothetical protein